MCGRAACDCDEQAIYRSARRLQLFNPNTNSHEGDPIANDTERDLNKQIRWTNKSYFTPFEANIAPGDYFTLISAKECLDEGQSACFQSVEICTVKWGIHTPQSHLVINARSDTVAKSKFFHRSVGKRAVVCVTGYIEWSASTKSKSQKQPYYFYRRSVISHKSNEKTANTSESQCLLWLAAIWDGDSRCVILTTDASSDVRWCHHRMPAVLASESDAWSWINPTRTFSEALKAILPVEAILCWHKIRPDFAQRFRMIKGESRDLQNNDNDAKRRKVETGKILRPYSAVTLEKFFIGRQIAENKATKNE